MIDPIHNTIVGITCRKCLSDYNLTVNLVDLIKWQEGSLVQDCFPYLSIEERELLISATCDECWNKTFPKETEEHDNLIQL